MIRECNLEQAVCLAAKGKRVIGLDILTSTIVDVNIAVQELKKLRFLVDEDDLSDPIPERTEEAAEAVPEDGTDKITEPQAETDAKADEVTERKPEGGEHKKTRGGRRNTSKEQREQEILRAWKGGERTIKEIMEITGYSYGTVTKYIPRTAEG